MGVFGSNFSNNFTISGSTVIVPETVILLRKNIQFQDKGLKLLNQTG